MTTSATSGGGRQLSFHDLSYSYSRTRNLAVDLAGPVVFHQGRTALLGPNGAGKSTLLAIAAGALNPDKGQIRVNGGVVRRKHQLVHVAWLPQVPVVDRGFTCLEYVSFQAWLKGVPSRAARDIGASSLKAVGLEDQRDDVAHRLSVGTRARLCLAGSLATGADYLLLDEPMAALDPAQRRNFAELVEGLAEHRVVVVSTHDVIDLERSFDWVVVLQAGKCIFQGSVADFMHESEGMSKATATESYVRVLEKGSE